MYFLKVTWIAFGVCILVTYDEKSGDVKVSQTQDYNEKVR